MSDPLRVAFLSPAAQLGGAEQFLRDLTSALPETGVRPIVYLATDGPLVRELERAGVETRLVPWPREVLSIGESLGTRGTRWLARVANAATELPGIVERLERALRRDKVEVVQSNGLKAELLAAWLGRRLPRVWYLHDFLGPRPWARRLLGPAPRAPRWVWCPSEAVLADVRRALPRVRGRSSVLPSAFDFARLPAVSARGDALEGPGLRVGLVATFAPWKGHLPFLEAAAVVRRTRPDVHFFVVGGEIYDTSGDARDAYRRTLLERASRPDLAGAVTFTGFRHDVAQEIAALDVCVHASTAPEPFGRSIVEALAVGRATIASDAGGAPEALSGHGLLVTPGDVTALAAAILRLVEEPELRARLAASGRASVVERYDSRVVARQAARLYRRLGTPRAEAAPA